MNDTNERSVASAFDRPKPIEDRLRAVRGEHRDLCVEAALDIESWKATAQRTAEALSIAMQLTSQYAHKSGFYEGGYDAILNAHADPRHVAKTCLERFEESGGTTQQSAAKPRKASKKTR